MIRIFWIFCEGECFCENLHTSGIVLLVPVLHVLIGGDGALGGILGVQSVVIINIPKSFDFASGLGTLVRS